MKYDTIYQNILGVARAIAEENKCLHRNLVVFLSLN